MRFKSEGLAADALLRADFALIYKLAFNLFALTLEGKSYCAVRQVHLSGEPMIIRTGAVPAKTVVLAYGAHLVKQGCCG